MDAGFSRQLHCAEYQIWSGSSLRDIIATDNGIDQISIPPHRIQENVCYRSVKSSVEGNPNSALLKPGKCLGCSRDFLHTVFLIHSCQSAAKRFVDLF